jgi:hypothetical protein
MLAGDGVVVLVVVVVERVAGAWVAGEAVVVVVRTGLVGARFFSEANSVVGVPLVV